MVIRAKMGGKKSVFYGRKKWQYFLFFAVESQKMINDGSKNYSFLEKY